MSLATEICIVIAMQLGQGADCDKIGQALENVEKYQHWTVLVQNTCKLYLHQNKSLKRDVNCHKLVSAIKQQRR